MNRSNNDERKVELISGLRDVRERILALAASLQPGQRDEIYLGTWSPREMLAHLAGWDETNFNAANEILSGELPGFYGHFDRDWATYNARLVNEHAIDDFEDLLSSVRGTQKKLLDLIEDIPADDLWKDRGIRAKRWKVTIGSLLEVELQDEEQHYSQLKHFIEGGLKS